MQRTLPAAGFAGSKGRNLVRYRALADALRGEIAAGVYRPGDTLPTERALAVRFQLSRGTVREALRALEDDGLIDRRQGSGTVVLEAVPATFVQSIETVDRLLTYPPRSPLRLEGRDTTTMDAALARELGVDPARVWARLDLRRFAEGGRVPLSLSTSWFPPDCVPKAEEIEGAASPLYRILEARMGVPFSRARVRIDAVVLSPAQARLLDAPPDSAAIRIIRAHGTSNGQVVQVSVTIHSPHRYAFEAIFDLEQPKPHESR